MFYLIPISILTYKYRMNIGYYFMKSYSYLEIQYNRWYNNYYLNPNYKLYINGALVNDNKDIYHYTSSEKGEENLNYEIEYIYKNKLYRILGNNLEILLDFVENIDNYMKSNVDNKIFRWISAFDEDNNCYLDIVKKYSGPLGDFYGNIYNLECYSKHFEWLKDKKITLIDFRLDEYILNGKTNL